MRRSWSTFAGQFILIGVYETANELIRQAISQYGTRAGMENAQHVAAFERTHGFFVEPAWQAALAHTYHLFGLTIGWAQLTRAANLLYTLGHPIVVIGTALWIFYFRTDLFSRMRNIIFICDALALITYHIFPMAPPRMTTGLTYNGHPYHFVDTVAQMIPSQRVNDEFAAMPSVHICYALIVGLTLAWALRPWVLRGLVLLYPVAMLVAVVVTANHYLMDAVGGAIVFTLAAAVALPLHVWWQGRPVNLKGHAPSWIHRPHTAPHTGT